MFEWIASPEAWIALGTLAALGNRVRYRQYYLLIYFGWAFA